MSYLTKKTIQKAVPTLTEIPIFPKSPAPCRTILAVITGEGGVVGFKILIGFDGRTADSMGYLSLEA